MVGLALTAPAYAEKPDSPPGQAAKSATGDPGSGAVQTSGNASGQAAQATNGAPKATNLLAYDSPPYGLTIGAADGEGLMVWGSPFGVFARGVATTDFIGPAFPVAGSGAVGGFAASVARMTGPLAPDD